MYGDDYRYANTRLEGTIVRYDGKPVIVEGVMRGCKVAIKALTRAGEVDVVDLKDLDLKPVPLGYVNVPNVGSIYLCRVPKRNDWRQGLRSANCKAMNAHMTIRDIPPATLGRAILGRYPGFAKALSFGKKGLSKAWCRDWSVDRQGRLQHKARLVGWFNGDDEPVLDEGYEYLMESLEESRANNP